MRIAFIAVHTVTLLTVLAIGFSCFEARGTTTPNLPIKRALAPPVTIKGKTSAATSVILTSQSQPTIIEPPVLPLMPLAVAMPSQVLPEPAPTASERTILAVAEETQRKAGRNGRPLPLHGLIKINGHSYPFTTGGRGRGSIPFATYQIDGAERKPYLGGISFPLSDIYDPIVKDTRDGLFIHRGGNASMGCIAIPRKEWPAFERDMRAVQPKALKLVPGGQTQNS